MQTVAMSGGPPLELDMDNMSSVEESCVECSLVKDTLRSEYRPPSGSRRGTSGCRFTALLAIIAYVARTIY